MDSQAHFLEQLKKGNIVLVRHIAPGRDAMPTISCTDCWRNCSLARILEEGGDPELEFMPCLPKINRDNWKAIDVLHPDDELALYEEYEKYKEAIDPIHYL